MQCRLGPNSALLFFAIAVVCSHVTSTNDDVEGHVNVAPPLSIKSNLSDLVGDAVVSLFTSASGINGPFFFVLVPRLVVP